MDKYRLSPKLVIGLLIVIFFGISLLFRISLPYDRIFSGEWVKFSSIDAYYYMRLVDNMVHNFPNLTDFDPFFIYPGGASVGQINFFYQLLSGVIWIIGLGSPTQHTIDVVGAFFPPVLAALTVIPVYFIGKALFNRWAGVLAAALIAVSPGEFLGRSILGFGDTPVIEILLTTTGVAFLILAIKTAVQRQLTFGHLIQRDWAAIVRPLVFSLLAGIFLGIYLLTWLGGLLFVFIISLYFIIQFIIDHLRGKSSDYLGIVGFIFFLVASIIFLPFSPTRDLSFALVVALLIPLVLSAVSRLMSSRGLKPIYYPLTLIGVGMILVVILLIIDPGTLSVLVAKFRGVFFPTGATATTTLEMQPFLYPAGTFSTLVAWGNFTTSFFLTKWWPIPGFALISFVILIWLFIKQRSDEKHRLLFFVWTLVILAAALAQRRFAYYLVVNVVLLSAYLSWLAIWYAGLRKLVTNPEQIAEGSKPPGSLTKRKRVQEVRPRLTMNHINVALAIIVVFIFIFFFNISQARVVASQARFAPSDAWQASLLWMKENTPEPLGDPDAYYQLYEEDYKYPESAYGVTSWWDYGYWITRTAHRLPSANPSQASEPITEVAELFLSQEESRAGEIMAELKSSYIIADYAMVTTKFWAVVTWAGRGQDEFFGIYHLPYEGELMPVQLFYPEYYRSLIVRLYNFDGQAVTTESPLVVAYAEKVKRDGTRYRQITDIKEFSSYQEALDYVESKGSANNIIVGVNQFSSPMSLEAVPNYKLVYGSEAGEPLPDGGTIPGVKIFEYIPRE
jgi:oligosaccharyl transferase (archaeosortase A-associated)